MREGNVTLSMFICVGFFALVHSANAADDLAAAMTLRADGNYKEAYEKFEGVALDQAADPKLAATALVSGIDCLNRLNQTSAIDAFRAQAINAHPDDWRLLQAAAKSFINNNHYGFMIAGEFERGRHRGGGERVNAYERDRVRALRLYRRAMPSVASASAVERRHFYLDAAQAVGFNRSHNQAWRLQVLTNLDELPDCDRGYFHHGGGDMGAPVDGDGKPVYYGVPETFQDAANDGERWRWLLEAAKSAEPRRADEIDATFADFLWRQFGVQTMAYFGRNSKVDLDDAGPYAVHTLKESETIAKLATGVKRFRLPDEFNFIKIYQDLAKRKRRGEYSLNKLASIFSNRRQYPRAAETWRENIKRFGPGHHDQKRKSLKQIIGDWGRFEPTKPYPAGTNPVVQFRFRNANHAAFAAREIDVDKLLNDVKAYLKSNPRRLDWNEINVDRIGYRLVRQNETKYLGKTVAEWNLKLDPRESHFDRTISVETPLAKPGAYLLTAKLADGNVSRVIVWVADMVILKKPLDDADFYFVADAETGAPVPGTRLEMFGYRQKRLDNAVSRAVRVRQYDVLTREYDTRTNQSGVSVIGEKEIDKRFRWLTVARTDGGRLAFLGFRNVWFRRLHDSTYKQTKVYVITDRPVYRPEQTMKYNIWVRKAQYDMSDDAANFANRSFTVEIRDARGEVVMKKATTADRFGGLSGEFPLPPDAALGTYRISLLHMGGGGSFRVEEYKKPEFEVSVEPPGKPVKLGDEITAKIKAEYYFGAPVTQATVKYKVLRHDHRDRWFPPRPWDWLYGSGYWWFAPDYEWFPGWRNWGCRSPRPWWIPRPSAPPELLMRNEVPIGPDGTVDVKIDTSLAKTFFGDRDHRYEITAEVVDLSRRTIVGKGSVIAAREPFKVRVWADHGYFRAGETARARFNARTVQGEPVSGEGELKLNRITYDAKGKPSEKTVQTWSVKTDAVGNGTLQFTAAERGQYRLSCSITGENGDTIEGAYVFTVRGEHLKGGDFRFNALEVIADKAEYEPGDTARLMINTERRKSSVLFFPRPSSGVYLSPKMMSITDKTAFASLEIGKKDMPNTFVEAVTISDGAVHTVVRELVVPPEKRVLNLALAPSKERYKPGEKAKVKLTVTDFFGKPVTAATVVSVYDKSVEYISGGSNVPAIKPFFWKWRRRYRKSSESSLQRFFSNLLRKDEIGMADVGVFGALQAPGEKEELSSVDSFNAGAGGVTKARRGVKMMKSMAAPTSREQTASTPMADAGGGDSGGGEEVTVRTQFADTAFWSALIRPDENGEAEIELDMPENLTTWKIKAWSLANGTRVGQGETEVITSKDFIVRLQAPRFFVQTDKVTLSAIVHNYHETAKKAAVTILFDGDALELIDESTRTQSVTVEPDGEVRVDWRVAAVEEGEVGITMKAVTKGDSDAMKMSFPVRVHGMLKTVCFSGWVRPEDDVSTIAMTVPKKRKAGESVLEIRYSPTLAMAMIDALPYLADYPHGCTEQTLNRFLPAVIVQKVLRKMDTSLSAISEHQTNLNAQEIGDDGERKKQWKRWKRQPVFDDATLDDMVAEGIKRLANMQVSDGGWGWFSGYGERSYPHTTAVVVHGLQIAKANGAQFDQNMLARGLDWLEAFQHREVEKIKNAERDAVPAKSHADAMDALAFMILVDAGRENKEMTEFLYRDRTHLPVYAMAMFGLALEKLERSDKLAMIMRNIKQYLVKDPENQTAYLNLPGGRWWRWYGDEIEAQAYYLKLLARVDPKDETCAWLVKYLLNNRKHATYWKSTRDTAACVEAFAEYLRQTGEDEPNMTVEVLYDGKVKKTVEINKKNLFFFDNKVVLTGKAITGGDHTVEIRRKGKGPVYFNAYLTYFTLADFIKKAGLEIKVERNYYRLEEVDKSVKVAGTRGQALDQKVEKFKRVPIKNLDTLVSGDLVEIELVLESKNDYEYLVFEDFKPAGFETCEVRSGYNGNAIGAYVEFRDEKVCFFARRLARGRHSVSYRARAEIPGEFSALPAAGSGMYAPELKANSDEMKIGVKDE